ncbi:hypothetical protein CDL12_06209 [Handroanthus impetiginosus]|uniref:Uncharacterized protein n=1 Tax=Handroanthus impetiginosus TaxID=429701 RepID=A0A2G9HUA9_9LAMI|nr:hypothetical protein CDL12_06209 [Handroanthus impetiginosus]
MCLASPDIELWRCLKPAFDLCNARNEGYAHLHSPCTISPFFVCFSFFNYFL